MARPRAESVKVPTTERILAAGREVFADRGFGDASLADIAQRAGIRRSSLLYHFSSKEALYAAVVERTFGDLTTLLASVMREPRPFAERAEALTRAFAVYLAEHPHAARVVVRELLATDGPGQQLLIEQVEPLLQLVAGFLEREGGAALRPGVSLRAVLLQIASDLLLQNAAQGPLRAAMWGPCVPDRAWAMARILLFDEG